jgi:hypothetical protein
MIVAVSNETSESTVNAVIRGAEMLEKNPDAVLTTDRNPNTELGKSIISGLIMMAKVNIGARQTKQLLSV